MGAVVWKEKQRCSVAFQSKRQLFLFSSSFLPVENERRQHSMKALLNLEAGATGGAAEIPYKESRAVNYIVQPTALL